MVTAWFMGSPDTNPFCSMRETLAHMHLACPSPPPISPKSYVFFSPPFYSHPLHLQPHHVTRPWQPSLGPGQADHLQPQEEDDEERGPQ